MMCNSTFVRVADYAKLFRDHIKNDYNTLTKLVRKSKDDTTMLLHAVLSPESLGDSKSTGGGKAGLPIEVIMKYAAKPQVKQGLKQLMNDLQMEYDDLADEPGFEDGQDMEVISKQINDLSMLLGMLKKIPLGGMGLNMAMRMLPPQAMQQFEAKNPELVGRMRDHLTPIVLSLGGAKQLDAKGKWSVLQNSQSRNMWEAHMSRRVDPWFDSKGLVASLERSKAMFTTAPADEGSVFMAELLEKVDVRSMPQKMRSKLCPALWRYRAPFSLEDFAMELGLQEDSKIRFPVLSSFLADEPALRALRYLPGALEFQSLMVKRYNRTVDRERARAMTIAEAIASANNKQRWKAAFEGFKKAWREGWKFVERFGCLELPK
eukprot:664917-Amorphochlora_amoeboformis.AAC.1